MVRFSNGRIIKYAATELVFRMPAEHTVDGSTAPGEVQYLFNVFKMFSSVAPVKKIRVSYFLNTVTQSNVPSILNRLVTELKKIPTEDMHTFTETNPQILYLKGPTILNTYFTRPIKFWAYNGTSSEGDCSRQILRFVFKEPLEMLQTDVDYYQSYLKNLTGIETNARTVVNYNKISVLSCGDACNDSLSDLLWFSVVYAIILVFTLVQLWRGF